jgi:integrase
MTTLLEFFDGTFCPLRLRGRSENTRRLYRCTLRSFKKFLKNREPTLSDLDDLVVARFLEHRASKRSLFTAEKERTQILSLWRFANDRGLVEKRPCVPPTPLPERIPEAWTIDQVRALIQACNKEQGMIGTTPSSLYFKALVCVAWDTAERIGCVMSLKGHDYQQGKLLARAEYRKGRKRDKLYSLRPSTQALLDEIVMGRKSNDEIFKWDRSHSYLWERFGKIVDRAGLGGGRRAKFHALRRTAATHYAAGGGNATELLDHSSPRVTRAYLDPRFLHSGPPPCDVLPAIDVE